MILPGFVPRDPNETTDHEISVFGLYHDLKDLHEYFILLSSFPYKTEDFSKPTIPLAVGDQEELHVLAVDDSIIERKLVERLLKNSAYKVTTAENGLRALEYLGLVGDTTQDTLKANDLKVNLIITDYCMPGMTGYELMKKIKESSNLKEIPVVIMSSENIPTRIEKCLEGGAQEFMLKPLQQSDVNKLGCHMNKIHKLNGGKLCLGR